jgi:hypothetical protein
VPGVPCTTNAFKLRFASKPERHSIKIIFDSNGIAVLTPVCITDLPVNQILPINIYHDTIYIYDTINELGYELGWKIPIDSFYPNKSCINGIWNNNPNIGIKNSIFFSGLSPDYFNAAFFISEVYIIDSLNWFIELNANKYFTNDLFSKSITKFMLRFGLNKTIYKTQISFDNVGIDVLSRNNLTGISPSVKVPIKLGHDTVIIIDTIISGIERAFRLPIDTIIPGKSLNNENCRLFYPEWSRPSIGRLNGTLYKINFVDSLNAPYIMDSDINVYYEYNDYINWIGSTENKQATFYYLLNPCLIISSLWFTNLFFEAPYIIPFPKDSSIWLGSCALLHSDTIDTIIQTVILKKKDLTSLNRAMIYPKAFFSSNIQLVELSNHSFSIILTLRENAKNVYLRSYSMNGQRILNLKIDNNNQQGTFTVLGSKLTVHRNRFLKGAYIFELIADGKKLESKRIILS